MWEDYFVKSGKLIYNLDQSFSEYVNKSKSLELFGELENSLDENSTVEKEDLKNASKKEFSNILFLDAEKEDASNFFLDYFFPSCWQKFFKQ